MDELEVSAQDACEHVLKAAAKSVTCKSLSPLSVQRDGSLVVNKEDDGRTRQQQDYEMFGPDDSGQGKILDASSDGGSKDFKVKLVDESFAMPQFSDGDVANVCLPILCKPTNLNVRSATPSPTCVSALARDEAVTSAADGSEPSWTSQEFQEYLTMLELLQDVCSDAEGGDMCLSADCLGQMERLLTSLLPQGV
uniref:Uncharacterized protein n=1 Tax=Hyaloperonospora arabidopsidis (strain Emoy2) TaxID=559515 RepID=M4B2W5_HYAAE